VLEGTAFEAERLRRAAEVMSSVKRAEVVAVGGGVRNGPWMQIKADISGRRYRIADVPEAAALGAALCAATGSGVLQTDAAERITSRGLASSRVIEPDAHRHALYRPLYEDYRAARDALGTRDRTAEGVAL